MHLEKATRRAKSIARTATKALLIVGPQPPPIGGAAVTVQVFLEELARHTSIQVVPVNTSPPPYYGKRMIGFNPEKLRRAIFVTRQYVREIRSSDAVLVFANNLSVFTIVPFLLMLARGYRKPFYVKPVEGALDLYLVAQGTTEPGAWQV